MYSYDKVFQFSIAMVINLTSEHRIQYSMAMHIKFIASINNIESIFQKSQVEAASTQPQQVVKLVEGGKSIFASMKIAFFRGSVFQHHLKQPFLKPMLKPYSRFILMLTIY